MLPQTIRNSETLCQLTADFQSVEISERTEILLFAARGGSSIVKVPGYGARKGILFRTSSLAKGILFGNVSRF